MAAVNIRAQGVSKDDLVDLLYQIVSSINGLCAKLDADAGVADTNYTALCYTACFDCRINNSRGAVTGPGGGFIISDTGLTKEALVSLLYQIFLSWQTLMAKLDADAQVNSTDYTANYYTATYLWNVTNTRGNRLGNGTTYYFGPNSAPNNKQLIDLLYAVVNSLTLACQHLDADTGVVDTNYNALWYTATILNVIENSSGNTIGNASPY